MIIVSDIPNIPKNCEKCRFCVYGDMEQRGSNYTHCYLFMQKLDKDENGNIIPAQGCPNSKEDNS